LGSILLSNKLNDTLIFLNETNNNKLDLKFNDLIIKSYVEKSNFKNLESFKEEDTEYIQDRMCDKILNFINK
jgi:hypothetical protein